jgi:hypothetical protein
MKCGTLVNGRRCSEDAIGRAGYMDRGGAKLINKQWIKQPPKMIWSPYCKNHFQPDKFGPEFTVEYY